jgi:hypothetical protein
MTDKPDKDAPPAPPADEAAAPPETVEAAALADDLFEEFELPGGARERKSEIGEVFERAVSALDFCLPRLEGRRALSSLDACA